MIIVMVVFLPKRVSIQMNLLEIVVFLLFIFNLTESYITINSNESSSSLSIIQSQSSNIIHNITCGPIERSANGEINFQSHFDNSEKCYSGKNCARIIRDDVFSINDIEYLHAIALKGMRLREETGGPTILDINTGYIRDINGLVNLFDRANDVYDEADFYHYGRIIFQLKKAVESSFGISELYFTAPTFITRLNERIDWNVKGDVSK